MHGQVAALDGHGVVLATEDDEHSVVRMERVSAVRVMAAAPGPDVPAGAPQPSPPVVPPVVPPQAERRWGPSQTPVPA